MGGFNANIIRVLIFANHLLISIVPWSCEKDIYAFMLQKKLHFDTFKEIKIYKVFSADLEL